MEELRLEVESLISEYEDGNESVLEELIVKLTEAYEAGEPIVDDKTFDAYSKTWTSLSGTTTLPKTKDGRRVPLSYWIGSLDKMYTQEEIDRWIRKQGGGCKEILSQPKYDGVSGVYYDGHLYTRGDGSNGLDISHLLKRMKLPECEHAIRGELIISKKAYKRYSRRHPDSFSSALKMVASICNRLESEGLEKYIDFIAFEVLDKRMNVVEELEYLKEVGFKVPPTTRVKPRISDMLTNIETAMNGKYSCDGIVLSLIKERDSNPGRNPKHSRAFKVNGDPIPTTVTQIEWNASRTRKYIPTVVFETIVFKDVESGRKVKVSRATGHNASMLINRGLGVGAEIGVIRAGDVIPFIACVYEPSEDFEVPEDAEWISEVHLGCTDSSNSVVLVKRLSRQFELLGIEKIRTAKCKELIEIGFDDISDVLQYDTEGVLKTSEIKKVEERFKSISTPLLMNVYGGFEGISTNLLDAFYSSIPDFMELYNSAEFDDEAWKMVISEIEGFGEHRAKVMSDSLSGFMDWYISISDYVVLNNPTSSEGDLSGEIVCFTGFTNKALEEEIENRGGSVHPTMVKKVTILVYKEGGEGSRKYSTALDRGLPLFTEAEFREHYGMNNI
uniref:DNA ligase (NAD(+)) n=1 Tax=viral metagenome TaxID=1070528 RepID=A0A6C0JVI9_9ZZZZ